MKQIAVFAPLGTLDTQTGILNAAKCFAANGFSVEVFAVRNKLYPEPQFSSQNIKLHYLPFEYQAERESRVLVTLLFTLWMILTSFRHQYNFIFAGGVRGLISAYLYAFFRRVPIINYQTELYIGKKLDTKAAAIFKFLERRAAQSSLITIEHDEQRCKLLCEDLGIDPSKVVIVPNAPCGPAQQVSSDYLHKHLGISTDCKLLLSPGSLSESFESSKIVQMSQKLDDGWCCVVHSSAPRSLEDPYIDRLFKLNERRKVVFSLNPIAYAEIDRLLSSAQVGLVLYSSQLGENTSSVGLASGKLSHFLKLGIPVIVSDLPGLADFVREHQVGEVLEADEDLPRLLDLINADLAGYRSRCLDCFNDYLAYERAFEKVIKLIND